MSGLTVAEATTQVADFLDDPNNVRWTLAKKTGALKAALSACIHDYTNAGGTAFDEVKTGTTSASGALVVSTPIVQHIKSVQVVTGNRTVTIRSATTQDLEILDAAARSVQLIINREWQVPSTTTNMLVSNDAVTGPSWRAFDQWVCAQAALDLGITDNDKRPGLEIAWARYRDAVISRITTPRSRPAPLPRSDFNFADDLAWAWSPLTVTLQLGRIRGELW